MDGAELTGLTPVLPLTLCFAGGITGLWLQGNFSLLWLWKPASYSSFRSHESQQAQRQRDWLFCRGKNCSKIRSAQAICGLRQQVPVAPESCSSDALGSLILQGTDTQFPQLLASFLSLQSSSGLLTGFEGDLGQPLQRGQGEDSSGARLCPCSAGSAALQELVSSTEKPSAPQGCQHLTAGVLLFHL